MSREQFFTSEGDLRLQCWYCEKEIASEGLDPCAVVFITRWAEPQERQGEQQFFCHAECFRKSGSGTDLHVLDDPHLYTD